MRAESRDKDRRLGAATLITEVEPFVAGDTVIIGIPAGGVAVAAEIARAFSAPLDVCVVRKLRAPTDEASLGFGAIAEGGELVLDAGAAARTGLGEVQIARLIAEKDVEARELLRRIRRGRPPLELAGKTVIVVDDGASTGNTARAALRAARRRGARRTVLALELAPRATLDHLASEADVVVCAEVLPDAHAANRAYQELERIRVDQIADLLGQSEDEAPEPSQRALRGPVRIRVADAALDGDLVVPMSATGLVLFAHSSDQLRHDRGHNLVSRTLEHAGLATLVVDLLTPRERHLGKTPVGRLSFNAEMLARRLAAATSWAREQPETSALAVGYFGTSVGAAAALLAAADPDNRVMAVAARACRPDLADRAIAALRSPTLLLVGERDPALLELNRRALERLRCTKRLSVVGGATHDFEEPGALEQVARRAAAWFGRHLTSGALGWRRSVFEPGPRGASPRVR
jgi:putative phosphoribosyl transferase